MLTAKNNIAAKLTGIAVNKYEKFIKNIQEKRIEKERIQLQASLMLGCIKRIK